MNKEPKIIFQNSSSIKCMSAGESVRGHLAEFPFIEWDMMHLPSDDIINEVLKPFMTNNKRRNDFGIKSI